MRKSKTRRPAENASTRVQIAALPFRLSASGEWEGWPVKGFADHEAAVKEALEEAGLVGKIEPRAVGSYGYWKRQATIFEFVEVKVYPLEVHSQLETWREKGERHMAWLRKKQAALLVDEPELAMLIERFKPH